MSSRKSDALALLEEHGETLHALLTRLTLRVDVAEDLMQELFCKLVQSDRFAAAENRLAYATRMAMNLAFDDRRSRKRNAAVELDREPLATESPSPLNDLVQREELEQVLDAITRLPSRSREIVVSRFLQELDYASIGNQLGKSPHQVRALCNKAVKRLRRLLGSKGDGSSVARPAR